MIVRDLITRLGFETDKKKVEVYNKSMQNLKKTITYATAAITGLSASMFEFFHLQAKSVKETYKQAQALGMTVAELEALEHAQKKTKADGFINHLEKMHMRLMLANEGVGRGSKLLRRYGVELQDAQGRFKPMLNLLAEISDVMQNITQTEALNIARTLGLEPHHLNLLQLGSHRIKDLMHQYTELGGVITDDVAKQMATFEISLSRIGAIFRNIKRSLAIGLAPIMETIAKDMKEWVELNREFIRSRLVSFVQNLASVLTTTWSVIHRLIGVLDTVIQRFGGWENALKLASIALTALYAPRVLAGLNHLKTSVVGLGLALAATPLMQTKAILVGISVVLGTIIEDIYQWKKGNDSLFGGMLDYISTLGTKLTDIFVNIRKAFTDFMRVFSLGLDRLANKLTNFYTSLKNKIANLLPGFIRTRADVIGDDSNIASNALTPYLLPQPRNITINNDMEVNVPAGTTQEQSIEINKMIRDAFVEQINLASLSGG